MNLSLKRAVQTVQDGVRTQLWPLPILGVVLAVVAGILVPLLDVRVDAHLPEVLDTLVFNGDPGAAPDRAQRGGELAHHRDVADVLADRGHAAAGQQPVLPPAAAHLHPGPVRSGHPGDLPGHLHLLPDRAAFGALALRRRDAVRPPRLRHGGVPARPGQRGRPGAVPGPPHRARSGSRRCCSESTTTPSARWRPTSLATTTPTRTERYPSARPTHSSCGPGRRGS